MAEDNGGSVRVTLRDVYDVVQEVRDTVRILVEKSGSQAARIEDHESRLRKLEFKVWSLPSMAGLLAFAGFVLQVARWAAGS